MCWEVAWEGEGCVGRRGRYSNIVRAGWCFVPVRAAVFSSPRCGNSHAQHTQTVLVVRLLTVRFTCMVPFTPGLTSLHPSFMHLSDLSSSVYFCPVMLASHTHNG